MSSKQVVAELICWKIGVKVRGPLLTTSSAPLGFGIDAPFAQNAAGEYYMAGSLVKGRLKEAWQELSDTLGNRWKWDDWIGKKPPKQGEDWESERGLLQFSDFIFRHDGSSRLTADDVITYRIEIDRDNRTVKAGQNLMIQSPFAAGGEYWFEGRVWGIVEQAEAAEIETRLREGLCLVPALGAETTVGYGAIVSVDVTRDTTWAGGTGWGDTGGDRWGLKLRADGPLCLAGRRIADNTFESDAYINGGVIKGAIATLLWRLHGDGSGDVAKIGSVEYPDLCAEFSNIRVLHAKPVEKGRIARPCAVPLSAVELSGIARDAAFTDEFAQVPSFRVDWKDDWPGLDEMQRYFGVEAPSYELRVRTQIDTENRRAEDEALFAYRMLAARANRPRKDDLKHIEEYEWLSEIDFSAIAGDTLRGRVKSQLAKLIGAYGVPGVGKLKTRCAADRVMNLALQVARRGDKGAHKDIWVVTLQTPALLCDIEQIGKGFNDAFGIYKEYWNSVSEGALRLVRLYASQSLAGGGYLFHRFGRKRGRTYRPYVLTDAGSSFVLTRNDDRPAPERYITQWLAWGLPLAAQVTAAFQLKGDSTDWDRCPYIPQNGYGEIAVDQAWHWEKAL